MVKMKTVKEVYVIFNPYDKGYYDGYGYFRGILFSKKYESKENAILDLQTILENSSGKTYLKVESLLTYS
jgi:hypothetical protein